MAGAVLFVDAGAAMMMLLLAAIDEGLAAGVYGVTVPAMEEFKELLGIPDDVAVVAGVTIATHDQTRTPPRRRARITQRRRDRRRSSRWERW